jgi:hypothetical protein
MPIFGEQSDGGSSSFRVTGDVTEGLLCHAVNAQGDFSGKASWDVVSKEADRNPVALADAQTFRAQGIVNAQFVKDGRVELT